MLFGVLIFNFAPTLFRMPPSSAPMNTIHATAISQANVQKEINAVQQKENEKQTDVQKKIMAARAALNEKIKEQKEQKEEKEQQMAAANKKIKEQIEARAAANAKQKAVAVAQEKHQEAVAQKAKAEKAAKAAKVAKAAKAAAALTAEQKKLQQALMQQQLVSEQKNIAKIQAQAKADAQAKAEAHALAVAQEGAIDKYKAAILSAIQSNWRIDQVNSQLKCVYSVQLAPDGTVLSVKLIHSSGNAALDQSAEQAITVSSPLPVPSDPGLFNHFRELVLTLSPQGFLQSVSSQ
jgi:colicin import membrane protein